jgi:predicted Zn-dependent peptidase
MKVLKKYYKNSKETVYSTVLNNGLKVFLVPKEDYSETAAVFATKFGSIESNAKLKHKDQLIKGRLGVAHFLEHRMFDNPKGPVFDLFSKGGAISNAFTSFDKTAYYFVTSEKLNYNLELLLDFVQGLIIKPESVEKEKGIIIEELKMYQDFPDARLGRGILENLYVNHPVKYDIGGTIEEVSATTLEVLEACHQTFYHPKNMVLVIVGKMDVKEVLKTIEENQNRKTFKKQLQPILEQVNEPVNVAQEYREIKMPISTPKLAIGYKLKPLNHLSSKGINKRLIEYSIYHDILFDESTSFYQDLVKDKVITPSLEAQAFQGDGYNAMIIEAEVLNQNELLKRIEDRINSIDLKTLKHDFEIVKNMHLGDALRSFESPQRLAINYMGNHFDGVNVFEDLETIKTINLEDIARVANEIKKAPRSVFVISPQPKN